MVGAGKWGTNHIKTLIELDAFGAVVEVNSSSRDVIENSYPGSMVFNNIEESFKFNFDAYIVSTPPSTHFEISKKIISNGKNLLIEKPITLNLEDAIVLNELAKEKKVKLMVGHVLLFHPAFKKIKELINDGVLGKIQYMYSNRLNLGRFRNDENVLWSFAPHDIALFNYFFEDIPNEINSNGIDILQDGIHDTSVTTFKYSDKRMGHIFVSWLHPFKEHRFVLIGSKGMVHFEDSVERKPLIFHDKTVDLEGELPISKLGVSKIIDYDNELPLTAELKYFISRLDNGVIKIADGDSAVEVMKLLEKATALLNKGTDFGYY